MTDYLDGFQYENEKLKFFPTSEGFYNAEREEYVYNYTDHLGNVRVSYFHNGTGIEVLEENNYYPFGLKHVGYNALTGNPSYQYKYNGKELQETGMYDYGARFYMPDIGRWGVVDPLSEKYRRHSTYAYAVNNPIRFIDPDGMQVWPPEGGSDGQTWSDDDGDFVNQNGTWYKDNGAFMGAWNEAWRYESVDTRNTNGTPGYDGKAMLPDSNYDYTYDLMPGKQADDVNYWKNGESGVMASRFLETTGRDATAVENRTTTIEAIIIVATTPKGGGRGANKLEPNREAVGDHTTFQRGTNGKIHKYETYEKTSSGHFNPIKRYDGGKPDGSPGKPHVNKKTGESIPTPHVQGKNIPGGARAAEPKDIPR